MCLCPCPCLGPGNVSTTAQHTNSFKHLSLSLSLPPLPSLCDTCVGSEGGSVHATLLAASACRVLNTSAKSCTGLSPPPRLTPLTPSCLLCLTLWLSHQAGQAGSVSYDVLASAVKWPQDLGQAAIEAAPCLPWSAISCALSVYLVANALRLFMAPTSQRDWERGRAEGVWLRVTRNCCSCGIFECGFTFRLNQILLQAAHTHTYVYISCKYIIYTLYIYIPL